MPRRPKPRTEFGRVVRSVIETDALRIPCTNNGGFTKNRRGVLVASTMNGTGIGRCVRDPRLGISRAIREALDPQLAARPCETLSTMTAEKRSEMERLYGKKQDA